VSGWGSSGGGAAGCGRQSGEAGSPVEVGSPAEAGSGRSWLAPLQGAEAIPGTGAMAGLRRRL
jgi:hypothetical protein